MEETNSPDQAQARREIADRLEHLIDRFTIASGTPETMAGIIVLRRELFEHLMSAARLLDDDIAANEPGRRLLSQVRHVYALHQATWPVVVARQQPVEFRTSARKCTETLWAYIRWLRAE